MSTFGVKLSLFWSKHLSWFSFLQVYKNLGDSKFCGFYEQLKPSLMVAEPDLVKTVLIRDFDHFVDRRRVKFTSERDEIFNQLLSRASGDHWRSLRSILSPNFTTGRMKGMFNLVALKADALLDYINRKLKTQQMITLKRCFGLYTLEVISSCAFGMETNSLADENSVFNTMTENLFKPPTTAMRIKYILFRMYPQFCEALKINFTQPEIDFFKEVVQEALEQREKGGHRGDFLDLMMEARDNNKKESAIGSLKYPVTNSTVAAQSVLFLLAGYDTTANALCFTTFLLAQHPEQQQRLRRELKELILRHDTFTYQAIMDANYLDACISESLRLYPPGTLHRTAVHQAVQVRHSRALSNGGVFAIFEDKWSVNLAVTDQDSPKFSLVHKSGDSILPGTDVVVPRSTMVFVPIWSLHHDPRYWSQPSAFLPDRFLPENRDKVVSAAYLPFGLGPRNCIGMRFALMEAKLALAKVFLEFEVSCVPGQDHLILSQQLGLMRPSSDLSLVFTPLDKH
nr:cytochrome P450 3A11-like [Cherax quadricarinatus]